MLPLSGEVGVMKGVRVKNGNGDWVTGEQPWYPNFRHPLFFESADDRFWETATDKINQGRSIQATKL